MTAINIIVNYSCELYSTRNIIGRLSPSLSLAGVCMYVPGPMQRNSINKMDVIQTV